MTDIFEAIAAPIRRAILDELAERDGQTLFELCGRLAMRHGITATRQGISQHMEILESAGLVSTEREGRYKFHYFHAEPLRQIARRWPGASEEKESHDQNRAHQRIRRRPGEGPAVLHREAGLREKDRGSARRAPMADRRGPR